MRISSKVAATIGMAFVTVGSMALPASANPVSPESTAASQSSAAARPCGGPYRVGDDAVWYSCNNESEQICVRQYWPSANYVVWVESWGEHHNSWRWTIDMTKDMSYC